jgi:exodeoxyribonuclease-3
VKIISWNVNGLRAVYKRGFLNILKDLNADIVCLQEIKARKEQLSPDLINPLGYNFYINSANKKGYSGVLVYSRVEPLSVENKIGLDRFDSEGRFLKLTFPHFTLINFYIPHGGRDKQNLGYKLETYNFLTNYLHSLKTKNVVLIGDFNIAHQEIDLARPKYNKDNIMFTPDERKQLDKILELGFSDSFRLFNKNGGNYTWWPYMANARQRNLGWRIDYSFVSENLRRKVKNASILKDISGSDHCPINIEY